MPFRLVFTTEAKHVLKALEHDEHRKLTKVRRCLALLETNPRHPGLNSHKYNDRIGDAIQELWESYVENKTPAAWRVFWHYGPAKGTITIVAITPHP